MSQNSIYISTDDVSVNADFSVDIGFTNSNEISAFQFDLHYDNDVMELASGHTLFGRGENHTISTSEIADNIIRVVVFSASNLTINPGSGIVVNLNFTSKNEPGTHSIFFQEVVLSGLNSSQISASENNGQVTILGPKFKLLTTSIDFGQLPMQSNVNRTIQIRNEGNQSLEILSQSLVSPFSILEEFPIVISGGSQISITLQVDTSIAQSVDDQTLFETNDTDPLRNLQELTVSANIYSVNEIYIGSGAGELQTNISIPVRINNMDSFNGFQLDITMPNGIEFVANSISFSGRETDHTISSSIVNSNILRVIAFSPTNSVFNGNSGEVFTFSLFPVTTSGNNLPLGISNSIISNTASDNIESNSYPGSISINAPILSLSSSNINLGRVPITTQKVNNFSLTNSGSANLVIGDVTYSSNNLTSSIETPLSLSVNETSVKTLTFNPDTLGQFSGSISINHNGAESQNIIQVTADVYSPNYLYIEEQSVYIDENHIIKLGISNNDEIRAIQFDINIPTGFIFDYANVQALNILDDFILSSSDLGNGNYRFLIYNFGNNVIPVGSNLLLDLPVFIDNSIPLGDYNFNLTGVTLSNSSNSDVATEELEIGIIHVIENSAPVAVGDTATVLEDADLTSIDVIANDTDVDGDVLTLTAVSTDGDGTVSINADNLSVGYKPLLNFNGTETITYTVSDGELEDITGTLTITVSAVNDAPVAVDDTFTLQQGTTEIVTLIATDIDSDDLTYSIVDQPTNGSVTVDGNQATYTADASFDGSDSFTFTANDGDLNSNMGTMSIDVTLDLLTYQLNTIKTYPNPFDDFYYIDNTVPINLKIYDINGRILLRKKLEIGNNKIDASRFSSGFYIFKLSHKNKSISRIRIKR